MKRGSKQQTLSYPPARPTMRLHSVHDSYTPSQTKSIIHEKSRELDEHGGLGRKFDVIPEARNYKFEDVFHGKYGDNALLNPHNSGIKEHDPQKEALFVKVDKLEQSKKQAAATFAALCAASESGQRGNHAAELIASATQDQHAVLRDRIHVLNDLIQHPSSRICINHHMLESTPRALVAVTYNRYVRASVDSFKEVGEIQSPMAWFVPGAQTHVAKLLANMSGPAGDFSDGSLGKSLKGLLTGVVKSLPFQYATKKLRKSLRAAFPSNLRDETELGIPSTAQDARHPQPPGLTSHHVRVLSAETEIKAYKDKAAEKVTAFLISGVMDLNVLELWQNPSTNMLVRKSIIQTALQHKPTGQLTNVHTLHVKLLRGKETHVLTFRPFIGTEASTVTHLLYSGPRAGDAAQRGLLDLPEDPTLVQPLHHGRILPLKSYVCLGAHRESRYNEAQLNYIHSRAYTHTVEDPEEHHGTKQWKTESKRVEETPGLGLDPSLLPHADKIHWMASNPPAKATRISGKDCDVMASSYDIGTQIYTAITVISYPPFGTQYKMKKKKAKKTVMGPHPRPHPGHGARPPFVRPGDARSACAAGSTTTTTATIPLPTAGVHFTAKKAIQDQQVKLTRDLQVMQTHIQSLESKLARTRREGNTEHLMHEVLRRLQSRV